MLELRSEHACGAALKIEIQNGFDRKNRSHLIHLVLTGVNIEAATVSTKFRKGPDILFTETELSRLTFSMTRYALTAVGINSLAITIATLREWESEHDFYFVSFDSAILQ